MNNETIKYCKDVLHSINVIPPYIAEGRFKGKNQVLILQIIGDLIDSLSATQGNEKLIQQFTQIQAEFEKPDIKNINIVLIKDSAKKIEHELNEAEKVNHIIAALQLDVEDIMPLMEQIRLKQEEMRVSFQNAVDIDYKMYGKISDLTAQALEAYHFDVNKEKQVIIVHAQYEQHSSIKGKEDNPSAGKTEKEEKADKKQYLHIPPLGKKQFDSTIQFFKDNGAKFDRMAKRWYITAECNKEVLKAYLPKDSVRAKLITNKAALKENANEKEHNRQKEERGL